MTVLARQHVYPGKLAEDYSRHLEKAQKDDPVGRIIARDPRVFRLSQKSHRNIILNRLGWIDVVYEMTGEIDRIRELVGEVKKEGFRHLFVLGMGGSSLCPEVFGDLFGKAKWLKSYTIVDTTAPSRLDEIVRQTNFRKAFFIVSSKSGSTIETMSQYRFFFRLIKGLRPLKAGEHFAAITDEGSSLHRIARRNRFREIFLNPADIGGRYSALSYFGLVPGGFTGANLKSLLKGARERLEYIKENSRDCDALRLGLFMGLAAKSGLDKMRFQTTTTVAPYMAWVEQLVAESTGKEARGILPLDGNIESRPESGDYYEIRYRVKNETLKGQSPASGDNSRPYIEIEMPNKAAIGSEMLKWEMATAVASAVIGVNPFDEPNVAESKKNVSSILHGRRGPRKVIPVVPAASGKTYDMVTVDHVEGIERRRKLTSEEVFEHFFKGCRKGDYVAFLSYTERSGEIEERLNRIRKLAESRYNISTLRGYGPRFLHSTGQLFKGGSPKGHFLVFEREYKTDYDIPGGNISFERLIKAQAQGDIKAMKKRKRPVVSVNLKYDPVAGLDEIIGLLESMP